MLIHTSKSRALQRRHPGRLIEINYSSPLARGLEVLIDSGSLSDLVSQQKCTISGISRGSGRHGPTSKTGSVDTSSGVFGTVNSTIGSGPMTQFCFVSSVLIAGGVNQYCCGNFNSAGSGLAIEHTTVSGAWGVFDGGGVQNGGITLKTGEEVFLLHTRSTSTHHLYTDGRLTNTVSAGNNAVPATPFKQNTIDIFGGISWSSPSSIYYSGRYYRTLDHSEVRDLYNYPWAWARQLPHIFAVTSGAGAADLAGSATSTATGTAELTTQIQLTGGATSFATASGILTSAISLSGAAASVSVASGVLTTQVRLSGAALAQVLASGALTTQISLSGAAVMQALASADLTTTPAGLSGSASATATATGQLSTGILLIGEASCIAISAGGLTTAIQMTGAAVSVSTATGDLTVTSGFSASALAEVTATGTLSTQIQLDAAAVMQAIAAASLTTGEQTVAFYDELDAFYGDFAVQCSANGTPFNGILDTTDEDQFGTLSMSTHRLRYPAVGSAVAAQDEIMVSGVRYKVIEIPRRISRSEMVAELVKQP